eukprot:Selendium_serpulae@DN3415_c0_g1_i2.p1
MLQSQMLPFSDVGSSDCLLSHPISAWARYDAVWGTPLKRERSMDAYIMKRQATCSSPVVMSGPLLSLAVFWELKQPWREAIVPSLPSPTPTNCEAIMFMRSGTAEEPLLCSYWSDLKVLRQLAFVGNRCLVLNSIAELDALAKKSLHRTTRDAPTSTEIGGFPIPKGNPDSSEGQQATSDLDSGFLNGLLPFTENEILNLVPAFLQQERSLAANIVGRSAASAKNDAELGEGASPSRADKEWDEPMDNPDSRGIELAYERPNKEFVERLWEFLRRSFSLTNASEALQQIMDALDPFNGEQRWDQLGPDTQALRFNVLSKLEPDITREDDGCGEQAVAPLLPVIRRDNSTAIAEMIRLAVRSWQTERYGGYRPNNEASDHRKQWLETRKTFSDVKQLPFMLVELGLECLKQDLTYP